MIDESNHGAGSIDGTTNSMIYLFHRSISTSCITAVSCWRRDNLEPTEFHTLPLRRVGGIGNLMRDHQAASPPYRVGGEIT